MFVLFGSSRCYYARGGWNDMLAQFKTAEDAIAAVPNWKVRENWMDDDDFSDASPIEWWHVVDLASGKIVAGSQSQAYGADDLPDEIIR